MSSLDKIINERINKDLDMYTYKPELFNEFLTLLSTYKTLDLHQDIVDYLNSIIIVTIKDNNVSFTLTSEDYDLFGRKDQFYNLLQESVKYMNSIGKDFPNCSFFLTLRAAHPYFFKKIPIFCVGKPDNEVGILIPDNSFQFNDIDGIKYNWDYTKKILKSQCDDIENKINNVYFRGTNTGGDKHKLRLLLSKAKKVKFPLKVVLDDSRDPMYNFCKYKYLLNLPGAAPWSYRFKYLLLMKSLVINVSLKYKYRTINNGKWVNFFDKYFIPNKDFIEIDYVWGPKQTYDEKKKEFTKCLKKIESVYNYYEKNPQKYKTIVKNGYKKVNNITQKKVYTSIYKLLSEYTKRISLESQ
jgi:hypothetical protein